MLRQFRNSYGAAQKVTPGMIRSLRKRSVAAVTPEVLEVLRRKTNNGSFINTTDVTAVSLELYVRPDVILNVFKDLCDVGILQKMSGGYKINSNIKEKVA
jgi:hypothetical protein